MCSDPHLDRVTRLSCSEEWHQVNLTRVCLCKRDGSERMLGSGNAGRDTADRRGDVIGLRGEKVEYGISQLSMGLTPNI